MGRLAGRPGYRGLPWTPENAAENVVLRPERLGDPLRSRKPFREPCLVFVNSMSDLFHPRVPPEFVAATFGVMAAAPQHTFQVLTKRPKRMRSWFAWHERQVRERDLRWEPWRVCEDEAREHVDDLPAAGMLQPWPLPNVWLGTSIESRAHVGRADALRETPAAVRFVSAEPLLEPIGGELDLAGVDWLIVGGESGPDRRPFDRDWARELRDACAAQPTAFFLKQGSAHKPGMDRVLDGRTWNDMPAPAAVAA